MIVYVDPKVDFRCHISDSTGTLREVETDFFEGKCREFIEGYRYVPPGEIWTRSDGKGFQGEMISPWKPYDQLAAAQDQYERDLADLQEAYREGVNSI